jgi:hypothetical protein
MVKGMVGEKDNAETLRTQRSAEESEKNTGGPVGAVSSFRVLRKWCHDPPLRVAEGATLRSG